MTTAISAIPQTNGAPQSAQAKTIGADFNMFLKLLTTQMQNQDPLDPMDTAQYTQQLVQYSQVEQSMQQTGFLRDILSRMSAGDMAQASGFLGREAQFDTNTAGLSGEPAQWSYSLPREAVSVTAIVTDSAGQKIASTVLETGREGRFAWDGTLPDGGKAPHGLYSLTVKAVDASGNDIPAAIRSVGVVSSVTAGAGSIMLGVNGAELPSSALISVAERTGA